MMMMNSIELKNKPTDIKVNSVLQNIAKVRIIF
jgi:hypothetical protein